VTNPFLTELKTQPEAAGFLAGFLKGMRVPSLLFNGAEGSGKKTHALGLARSIFCKNGPGCAGCSDCRQVESKTHPDLLWVQKGFFWPEEEEKRKSEEVTGGVISAVVEKLNLAPLNAPLKIAIVPNAHKMNVSAQDKFLKTLEEPPSRVLIILVTDQPGLLLTTIQSRCRIVRFHPLAPAVAEGILRSGGIEASTAKWASRASGGNLTRAFRYADKEWREFLEKAGKDFDRGLTGGDEAWLRLVDEYEKLDPGFWDDEDLTASQRKSRVAEEALRAGLALWDLRCRGEEAMPEGIGGADPSWIRESLRRHLDLLPTHLNSRMVLDHFFLEARETLKTGPKPHVSWVESALRP